jgi:predicted transposase/invertase (TIGR01784 family)
MKLGIKPTVDIVFKRVFGSEERPDITRSFLNSVLARAGLRSIVSLSILNPYRSGPFRGGGDLLCEDETIIVIELSSWAEEKGIIEGREIADPLDRWLYFLSRGEEIDPEQPPEALHGEEYEEAMEIMAAFTKSEAARDLYRRRLEYRLEQGSIAYEQKEQLEKALAKGLAAGRAEGLAEGLAEGERERARTDAHRLKALGVELGIIVEATGLSREDVEAL